MVKGKSSVYGFKKLTALCGQTSAMVSTASATAAAATSVTTATAVMATK